MSAMSVVFQSRCARLLELVVHLFDDLATHGVQFVGGVGHRRVEPDQDRVHLVAAGQEADARMLVVAGPGENVVAQSLAICAEGGADDIRDRLCK